MAHHPQAIFGREDDPMWSDYFAAINMFYLGLNRLENELIAEVKRLGSIHPEKQASEDFEADIRAAVESFERAKFRIGRGIITERARAGL